MTDARGAIPPLPTYLADDGVLDEASQRRAVEHVLSGGADGVLTLGTSGEGPALPDSIRDAAIEACVATADGHPVLVGCAGHTRDEVLAHLHRAADLGATAALVLPPFYFPWGQSALGDLFEAIADASPIDLALYHIPTLTGNGFAVATVERLARHPRIFGMKDSHRDFAYHLTVRRRVAGEGFRVFQGATPLLLAALAAGSTDTICPTTALVPEWERTARDAVRDGDLKTAATAGDRIAAMAGLFNLGEVPMPVNFKAVAALLGLGPARPHEPHLRIDDAHKDRLAAGLAALGLDASGGATA